MAAPRWHPFDVTSRVLAQRLQGIAPSPELRAALADGAVNWENVVREASEQFVLAAFAAAVRDLGLAGSLDADLSAFLQAVYDANAERNRSLREQLAELVGALNRIGIEPVLLKGAIRLVDDLYPDPAWRMMWDIDILVPQDRLADAIPALREANYAPTARAIEGKPRGWDHYHYAALSQPRGCAVVEVHREAFATARQQRLLQGTELLESARRITFNDVNARVPSAEHQLVHLVGHCQILHRGYAFGRIGLRDRLEATALIRRSADGLAWPSLIERFAAAGYHRPLLTFLMSLEDGGFDAAPIVARRSSLARLQAYRVARQARSAPAMLASRRVVHCADLLTGVIMGRGSRRETFGLLITKARQRARELLGSRPDHPNT